MPMGEKTERDGSVWRGEYQDNGIFVPYEKIRDAGESAPAAARPGAPAAGAAFQGNPQYGTMGEGFETPFGAVQGGLPQGMGFEWHKLLLEKGQNAASNAIAEASASGRFNGLPTLERERIEAAIASQASQSEVARLLADNTVRETTLNDARQRADLGERVRQKDVELQQSQVRLDDARRSGDADRVQRESEYVRTLTFDRDKLAETARQFGASFGLQEAGVTGRYNGQQTEAGRQFDARQGLDVRRQGFDELANVAKLASNPRNYIEASFLGNARGTLAGQAPNNQIDNQPGRVFANAMGVANRAVPLGQPGSTDHYATQRNADGTAIEYYGNTGVTPDGDAATIPVGAFSRALMEGRPTSTTGNLGVNGGYATTGALRNGLQNLDRIRVADYLKGNDSERQQFGAVASYATGMSDTDREEKLNSFVPRTRSVAGGARYA